jgi:GNAT superfamily N-acetyltransferase
MRPQLVDIRVATPADGEAVTLVCSASYSQLYKEWYSSEILEAVLPVITKANPDLLASGTYYVAELDGKIVGCGGWSEKLPGGAPISGVGHIRHMATHPDFLGRGVGRRLIERSFADARARAFSTLQCQASLPAESFYARLGFERTGSVDLRLAGIAMPVVLMKRGIEEGSRE